MSSSVLAECADRSPYRGDRFPPEIIAHAVWLYFRFHLSLRDVEELLAERGVSVTYESIRAWCATRSPRGLWRATVRRATSPVPIHHVRDRLGHASVEETERYLHVEYARHARAVDGLDAYVL